jgi:hypothetical protein
MNDSQRLAALEDRVASLQADLDALRDEHARLLGRIGAFDFSFWKFGRSDDGRIPYVMTMGRLGIETEYWSKKPWGQGALLSLGIIHDRYGVYTEVEAVSCPDHPTVGVFSSVTQGNPAQKNVAFAADVASSAHGNVTLSAQQGDGIEVVGAETFWIGRIGGALKRLWENK